MRLRIAISLTLRLHWALLAIAADDSVQSLVEDATQIPTPIQVVAWAPGEVSSGERALSRRVEQTTANEGIATAEAQASA